jgi:drug/metabolite transporter (DMT)-like permease
VFAILLAATSALIWGTGDFLGGKAVQHGAGGRGLALSVTVVSQLCAIPMIALFLAIVPGQLGVSALLWGGIAGVAGLFGIVLLYQSLASGAMSVVAPTTAVTAAVVPMAGGLLQGERPGAVALIGAVCAIFAIGLVSTGSSGTHARVRPGVIALALASGSLFGIFFLLLAHADPASGMWPLAAARAIALPVGIVLLRPLGGMLHIPRRILPMTAAAGVLDLTANGLYLVAVHHGQISILAPIAALYPASTVMLAMVLHKERLKPLQMLGLGLAGVALVLAAS